MAIPWDHWPPRSAAGPTTDPSTGQTATQLREIVTAYVERASNHENRYAEPIELETIVTYATDPDLLSIILDVLKTRLGQGYPYTLKSLDILLHLLHAQRLPHPAFYPPCRALYGPVIALLASPASPTSAQGMEIRSADGYVKAKADEFLIAVGYDARLSQAWMGGVGPSTLWWGRERENSDAWFGGGDGIQSAGQESAWLPYWSVGQTYPSITTTTTTTTKFPHTHDNEE
ncbi:hypothetical protein QFC19_002879 [Naganishia cerealis]|uniref:Uncharacterized protein n=1 Tax=Naganishia cerealis TaxID=610337 RepID=A0ACC2W7I7_9TREE|nr:hypothetical protein QFC19_002879 [Naganishia cerealis]